MVPTRAITITVTEGLYGRFVEMARKQGMTPAVYGKLLFEAAYSARCGMTGDRELDAAVAAIGVEKPAAPAEAEAEQLRRKRELTLDDADHWKEMAALWEGDCKSNAKKSDATIAELRAKLAAVEEACQEANDKLAEYERDVPKLRALIKEWRDQQDALLPEMKELKANVLAERATHSEELANRDQRIAELEQRIATATMQPVEAVSATLCPAPVLTPDQARRARTYRAYGMNTAQIASTLFVEVSAVEAALRGAA